MRLICGEGKERGEEQRIGLDRRGERGREEKRDEGREEMRGMM